MNKITFKKGDRLRVGACHSVAKSSLDYDAFIGVVLEEGCSGGWDIYDMEGGKSIYGFSIIEKL